MKNLIIRIIVVVLFLVIALFVIKRAPEYTLEYKYKDGDLRVIFDDVEITRDIRKLPEAAAKLPSHDEILLSQDTIDILFDKYLFYDEENDSLITTSEDYVATISVGERTININGEEKSLVVPAQRILYSYKGDDRYINSSKPDKSIIYVPIDALAEVYNIEVEFKDKLIITSKNKKRERIYVKGEDIVELKAIADASSKTIATAQTGNYIDIYNYKPEDPFNLARNDDGELGYVETDKIKNYTMQSFGDSPNIEKDNSKKINIAWDYINENASSIGDKSSRSKISAIDVVAPTLIYLSGTDGDITYRVGATNEYMKWAKNQGYDVWVTVKNDNYGLDDTSKVLNSTKARNKMIRELLGFADKFKVDGFNIDFEYIYKDDAECLSQFVRELSVYAHKKNLIISVCANVPDGSDNWSLCYEHRPLSEAADYLTIMTYDQFGQSSRQAGPNASYDWVEMNIKKLVERDGVDSSKLLLGLAYYSRLWKVSGETATPMTLFMDKARSYIGNSNTKWNEDSQQYVYNKSDGAELLWIEDKTSISKKLELVEQYELGGTAIWRLGYETQDVWEAFDK